MKVVFIGSDPRVAQMARASIRLCWPGALPQVATSASEGLPLVKKTSPHLVLLQASLPDISVFEAISEMRCFTRVPLLVLGGHHDEAELITCLELGANDYISLPYDTIMMMAHIRALMRRVHGAGRDRREASLSRWKPLKTSTRTVSVN